jgi:hypothetical protein
MTSPKSEMSVEYIHNVYSLEKTKVTDKAALKRTAANKQAAAAKAAKAARPKPVVPSR